MFFPQPVAPIVPLAQMTTFAEGLDHPEGLAFDRDGVLWAGGEAGQIYRVEEGSARAIGNVGGFCLGITVSPQQDLIVCNAGLHCLQQVARDGRVVKTIDRIDGRPLVTPNFSVFDAEGNLYFSESGKWNGGDGWVYRLRASGVVERFAGPFFFANGLALNAEQNAVFVVESQRDRVQRIEIRPDGHAGNVDTYADGLARIPDGLAFDTAGNLYVTCYATDCIYRVRTDRTVELFAFDPEGTMLARPTNAAFGGPEGKTLVIANLGRWHLTAIHAADAGLALAGQGTNV